jgi:hypothetical protein
MDLDATGDLKAAVSDMVETQHTCAQLTTQYQTLQVATPFCNTQHQMHVFRFGIIPGIMHYILMCLT